MAAYLEVVLKKEHLLVLTFVGRSHSHHYREQTHHSTFVRDKWQRSVTSV